MLLLTSMFISIAVKAGGKRVVKKNSEDGTPEKESKRADKPRYRADSNSLSPGILW